MPPPNPALAPKSKRGMPFWGWVMIYWRSEWNLMDERDRARICEVIEGASLDEVTDSFVASAKAAGRSDRFTRGELREFAIWVRTAGCT